MPLRRRVCRANDASARRAGTRRLSRERAQAMEPQVCARARLCSPAFCILIAALGAIGLTAVPMSLAGDQALFTIAAERLVRGGVLYRDFWDLKQPGIFAWYAAAGSLFGFRDVGLHVAELLQALIFTGTLFAALRARGVLAATAAPLLALGIWYGAADEAALTQVEALVGLPLFLVAWTACVAIERDRPALFGACGLAAGAVLALKLLFAPIVAVMLIAVALATPPRRPAAGLRWFAGGLCLVLAPIVAYFVVHRATEIAWWTTFVLPPLLVRTVPHQHLDVLRRTASGFARHWLLAGGFAAYAAAAVLRRRSRDPLVCAMLAWLVVGCGVSLVQTLSWWAYQTALLGPPIAVLAACGLARATRGRRVLAAIALAIVLLPTAPHLARRVGALVRAHGAIDPLARAGFQLAVAPRWPLAAFRAVASALPPPPAARDDLFVFGQPLIYVASGRLQPVPINGWSPTLLQPGQWRDLARSLERAHPRFIYFDRTAPEDVAAVRRAGGAVTEAVARSYRSARRTRDGELFEYAPRRSEGKGRHRGTACAREPRVGRLRGCEPPRRPSVSARRIPSLIRIMPA